MVLLGLIFSLNSWADLPEQLALVSYDEREVFQWRDRSLAQINGAIRFQGLIEVEQVLVPVAPRFVQKDQKLIQEVVPVFSPKLDEKPLNEVLFNRPLVKEFNDKFKVDFGRLPDEQSFDHFSNKYMTVEYMPGQITTLEQNNQRQQDYGQFVIKRLAEFHIDDYAKSSDNLKAVYEVKEKLSNVKLELQPGYKVNMQYSLTENSFAVALDNPLKIKTKYIVKVDSLNSESSSGDEEIIALEYSLTKKTALSSNYKTRIGELTLTTEKVFDPKFKAHVTGSTGPYGNGLVDNKVVMGFTWVQ